VYLKTIPGPVLKIGFQAKLTQAAAATEGKFRLKQDPPPRSPINERMWDNLTLSRLLSPFTSTSSDF